MTPLHRDAPRILGPIPGPRAAAWLARDEAVMSPSYTRVYPLVVRRAKGAMIEDLGKTESALVAARRANLDSMRSRGNDPFAQTRFPVDTNIAELTEKYAFLEPEQRA